MDTTASRGGVVPDDPGDPAPVPTRFAARIEVAAMPDGRTIRFYAAAPSSESTEGAVRSVEVSRGAVRSESEAGP